MIIILMGVSGCGKTTVGQALRRRYGWTFLDGDDYHPVENKAKMAAGIPLTDQDRIPWLQILAEAIRKFHCSETCGKNGNALNSGTIPEGDIPVNVNSQKTLVIACSALKAAYRDILKGDLLDQNFQLVMLKGSEELLARRLQKRKGHFFDPNLLTDQLRNLETPPNSLLVDINLKGDEICDEIWRFVTQTNCE